MSGRAGARAGGWVGGWLGEAGGQAGAITLCNLKEPALQHYDFNKGNERYQDCKAHHRMTGLRTAIVD